MHLALASMAAGLGIEADLSGVAPGSPDYAALYAESAGRFLVSVDPAHRSRFEDLFKRQPLTLIGAVRPDQHLEDKTAGPQPGGDFPGAAQVRLAAPLRELDLRLRIFLIQLV